jgi:cytochrome c biogenesis factor
VILVGELSLWVALLMAAWAATVSFAGGALARRDLIASGERAIYATLAMVVLASLGLWTAIFSHDFSVKYVASLTSANLPRVYLFTALWAGQAGSLLFWCLILAIYSALAIYTNRTRNRALMPYVSGTLALVLIVFLATMAFGANPYERLDWVPPEGRGMNPQLQNPGMAIHPPSLYLGYLGTTIPFAFAMGALITGQLDAGWLGAVRRWALIAWFFTTTGILLGMWWAYVEPGWGGYWAWDPVENASLLPWLVNTAFLYSIVVQEKRGMVRKWNVTLVVSTFLLAIFATFITRNGITSSVHSFAQSPVGSWFAGLLLIGIIATAYLVTTRLKDMESEAELIGLVARSRRRYGGYIVSMGVVVIFAAFAGLALKKEYDLTFKAGDAHELTDPWGQRWRFVSQGVSTYDVLNREVTAIVLDVSRNGRPEGVITSEKRQHLDSRGAPTFEPSTEVGIKGSFKEDVYVVLAGVRGDESAKIRVTFNPMVRWVWLGGMLMAIGGLIVMWPQARRRHGHGGYAAKTEPGPSPEPERDLGRSLMQSRRNFLVAALRDDS